MADDNTTVKSEKTISLKQLKPNEYRLWVIQAEATFEVYQCLGIVLGTEPNPTPVDDDGTTIGPIGNRMQATITSWQKRHALAREALLKALEPGDMMKIYSHRHSAPAIWNRLQQEYSQPLDFEYIRLNSQLQSLRKDDKTTMDAHITRFNQLLQEVEYNKPSTIPRMRDEEVNLQFIQSLFDPSYKDSKDWETFAIAKGDWLRKVSTAELHAQV